MAESTVSGPFRSENGFQQLDENGEWVPVTGGGGGGGVTSVIAGSGVSVSSPTGAVTIANTGVTSIIAGSGISVSAPTGAVTISATGGGGGFTKILAQWGDTVALPAPTAVGQIYEVDVAYSYNAVALPAVSIDLPTIGNGFLSFALTTAYGVDPFTSPNFQALFNASTSVISLNPAGQIAYANFRIVYLGPVTAGPTTSNVFQTFVNIMYANPNP